MAEAKGIEQRPNAEQKGPPMVSCKTRGIVVRERIIVGRRGRLSKKIQFFASCNLVSITPDQPGRGSIRDKLEPRGSVHGSVCVLKNAAVEIFNLHEVIFDRELLKPLVIQNALFVIK
jgi:hypothetical protein